ncbi:MAG: hypothetical protein OXI69_15460 [Acidobacteriota bacterium]|nr:hypothetical protein [Acidobacteriota bacterium]
MNPVYLQIASDVILFLISAGVGIYLFVTRKSQVNSDRIDALEDEFCKRLDQLSQQAAKEDKDLQEQVGGLSERLSQVEGNRPTLEKLSKSVGQVHNRIDETKGMVSRLEGEFRASNRTLGLIHEYLLNKGKG